MIGGISDKDRTGEWIQLDIGRVRHVIRIAAVGERKEIGLTQDAVGWLTRADLGVGGSDGEEAQDGEGNSNIQGQNN